MRFAVSDRAIRFSVWMLTVGLLVAQPGWAEAKLFRTLVTGEDPAHVIFVVTFDPAVAGSAVVIPVHSDTLRLDGIDVVPGTVEVVVGAQSDPGLGGAITHYNALAGTTLPAFVPSTVAGSKPSTILSTETHAYYIENQFGFGTSAHVIKRTPFAGPAGTTELVFNGAAATPSALVNLEGLELVGSTLYFFAADNAAPPARALYSIGLTAGGVWDGLAPAKLLSPLAGSPAGDGSDELDLDESTGIIYGSNVINAEVIAWDTGTSTGGFLIGPGVPVLGPNTTTLSASPIDGIRATGTGYLVLTGLNGTIFSIDLAGVAAGLDDSDVIILEDNPAVSFDDLTPLTLPIPLLPAGAGALLGALLLGTVVRSARTTSQS